MINCSSRLLFFLLFAGILSACKKEKNETGGGRPTPVADPDVISYKFTGQTPAITITRLSKTIEARFDPSVTSGNGLVAAFQLTAGAKAAVNGAIQTSGVTQNNFNEDIFYHLSATGSVVTSTWKVIATNNDHTYKYQLGHFLSSKKTNDRPYEWYYDQATTGVYSAVNCGPSSVTMAIKWANQSFPHPPEYARNLYGTTGGWWFTSDILGYLSDHTIPRAVLSLGNNDNESWDKIIRQVDYGRVVILCLDMNYVTAATVSTSRVDKFYSTTPNWGHFIVVKGYRIVDGEKFYEVYDPNSWSQKNADDQTLKGRGRFYRSADIFKATSVWWNYAITVNPQGMPIDIGTYREALDPSSIPHARGR